MYDSSETKTLIKELAIVKYRQLKLLNTFTKTYVIFTVVRINHNLHKFLFSLVFQLFTGFEREFFFF